MTAMDESKIRKRLWNSVDARFQRGMLMAAVGSLAFFGAIMAVLWQITPDTARLMVVMGCAAVLPLFLWRLWTLIRIFRHIEQYTLFRTKLSAPRGNQKAAAFPVAVPGGGQCWTDRIFYIRNLQPRLSDWLDQTVTVAWNRETGRVIVIGK